MSVFEALTPAERARQLGNPEGAVGLAVAEWLNETNRQATQGILSALGVEAGHRVLEIGFGNGRAAPEVIALAPGTTYCGIDISPTMVAEAGRFNAALVASGRVSLHLASAEAMPFADQAFDSVFAIGVIHFWTDPAASLAEVLRVMRPGGTMLMACLAPGDAPDFARPEHGFHLRDAASWDALCRDAGFSDVRAETIISEHRIASGETVRRQAIRLQARAP